MTLRLFFLFTGPAIRFDPGLPGSKVSFFSRFFFGSSPLRKGAILPRRFRAEVTVPFLLTQTRLLASPNCALHPPPAVQFKE